jgi:ABC exporter DevB family membrane fusion protein
MKSRKRLFVALVLGVVVIGAGIAALSRAKLFPPMAPSADAKTSGSPGADEVYAVVLACTGRIEGESEAISVGAGIDGRIAEIRVKEGEQIAAGAILAVIEHRELRSELSEAQAVVKRVEAVRERLLTGSRKEERERANAETAAAEAMARQAEARYERFEKLFQQGVISADARDEALRNVEVARAGLRAAQKQETFVNVKPLPEELDKAEAEIRAARDRVQAISEQMKKCEVKAPVAGTVLRTNMKVGETYSTFTPQPIVTLADTSALKVRAEVDERDIARIQIGQRVALQSDAFSGRKLYGTVSRISAQMGRKKVRTGDPAEKSDRDVLEVLIDVEGKDRALVVGLRVTAQFLSAQNEQNPTGK